MKGEEKNQSWWAQFSGANAKRVLYLPGINGEGCRSAWALFAIQPGLCLENRLKDHTVLHEVTVSRGTHSSLALFPTS